MIERPQGFVRNDLVELIFARSSARHAIGPALRDIANTRGMTATASSGLQKWTPKIGPGAKVESAPG
jgi:hypothetical protein